MAKNTQYLSRVAQAAYAVDAAAELSPEALSALALNSDRMAAAVFSELYAKGYILAERRGWNLSAKAQAYRAAQARDA